MKKLLSWILAASLIMMFVPALAQEITTTTEEATVLGDWYLTALLGAGSSINPASTGMGMQLTLNEDGTVHAVVTYQNPSDTSAAVESNESDGTWEEIDGSIIVTIEDSPMSFVYDSEQDALGSIDENGSGMVFGREPAEADELPEIMRANSAEDFYGHWQMTYILISGMGMSADAMGDNAATMDISEDLVVMTDTEGSTEGTPEFVDGALIVTSEGSEEGVKLSYNSNGWISISYAIDEENAIVMYYAQVEEE